MPFPARNNTTTMISEVAYTLSIVALLLAFSTAQVCSKDNYTCPFYVPCCSKFGYCGSTIEYCSQKNCVEGCDRNFLEEAKKAMENGSPQFVTPIDFNYLVQMESRGVFSACKNPKHAALTFDDGINPKYTPKMLKILKKHNVEATFFILGQSISKHLDFDGQRKNVNYKKNRKTLRSMFKQGHNIGSHTFDHGSLTELSLDQVSEQMNTTNELIAQVTGYRTKLMRAPKGNLSVAVLEKLRELGYVAVHWNYNPEDWVHGELNDGHVLNYVKNQIPKSQKTGSGPIILQHDIRATVRDQPAIIKELKKKGYKLVSLQKCLGIRPYRK